MKRMAIAGLGALLLALSAATGAFASAPPGSVTVESSGCDFTVHIALDQAWPVVTWKVKVYDAANWKDGETLIKGQALDDADGKIDAGPYTLPAGHYNVAVDNEASVDGSAIVTDFTLNCAAPTPTPTTRTRSRSTRSTPRWPTPTPTPTGEELGETGTPTPAPTGEELGETGTGGGVGFVEGGGNVTPPPTDTPVASSSGADSGLPLVGLSILGIASTLAWFTRRSLATARASRRR